MAPLIALAIQALPSLLDMFDAPESVKKVSTDIVEVAQAVTGAKTETEATAILKADPDKYTAFKLQLEENKFKWEKMYLEDIADARKRDTELHKAGYVNRRANLMLLAAYILVTIGLVVMLTKMDLNPFQQTTLTLIIGRMLGYIDQGFNFEFGTTRSSHKKDDTISTLSRS